MIKGRFYSRPEKVSNPLLEDSPEEIEYWSQMCNKSMKATKLPSPKTQALRNYLEYVEKEQRIWEQDLASSTRMGSEKRTEYLLKSLRIAEKEELLMEDTPERRAVVSCLNRRNWVKAFFLFHFSA